MKGKKMKTQSKRLTCRKKYKIEKKVRDHNKKVRKQEKKSLVKKYKAKDPGIPNLYPFKEQLLKQIEEKKQQDEERKKANKQNKIESRKRKLEDLQKDAEKRGKQFAKKQALEDNDSSKSAPIENSKKSFYREFRKVVDNADVIIQVLDARDPIGCRCPQLEEMVMASGQNKKLVLMLNKIDLVPKNIVEKWLKYLRREFPAVAFKASTQTQKQKLSQSKVSANMASSSLLQSSKCIGAGLLMKLLGNYCRNADLKTTITVGVVGFPNVGKSSVINSLKRSRACNVGATPGVTKNMQEIQLDQHVKLLDCPGIVMGTGTTDTQIILRNAVKIETLEDPTEPVEAILSRCNKNQIMEKYCVPNYQDTNEFLSVFAKRLGKLKKGGIPDQMVAAKVLLQDWNSGKITFYTHPPVDEKTEHDTAQIVQYKGAGFDLDALNKDEEDDLKGLLNLMDSAMVLDPSQPITIDDDNDDDVDENETDENVDENVDENEQMDEESDEEVIQQNNKQGAIVTVGAKKKGNAPEKEKEIKLDSIASENNVQINRDKKKAFRRKQKEKRKQGGKKEIMSTNDDYDFGVL